MNEQLDNQTQIVTALQDQLIETSKRKTTTAEQETRRTNDLHSIAEQAATPRSTSSTVSAVSITDDPQSDAELVAASRPECRKTSTA